MKPITAERLRAGLRLLAGSGDITPAGVRALEAIIDAEVDDV